MSENKFENQVQRLMDELNFTPSEELWPAIKNKIREKRRKRFFFFLVPVLAGLFICGYYFLSTTNSLPESQQSAPRLTIQKPANTTTARESLPEITTDTKKNAAIKPGEKNHSSFNNGKEQTKMEPGKNRFPANQVANQFSIAKHKPSEVLKTTGDVTDPIVTLNKQDHHPAEKKLIEPVTGKKPEVIDHKDDVENLAHADSLFSDHKLKEVLPDTIAVNMDTAKIVLVGKDRVSKWTWGIHVAIGASKSGSRSLPGVEPASMDFNASPQTAGGGGPLFTSPAKSSAMSKAFEAGFILKKQLTLRSSIVSGLQYFYASDRLIAGTRYDSTNRVQSFSAARGSFNNTVNSYYLGNGQWYNNHYHFIELPLQYQYLVNKKSKIPVQFNAGVIFSQLISTNGLIYDRALAGIYYEDKDQFNRSMLSLTSGINIGFNHKQKLKWSIGPQVKAGITGMRKAAYDQNKYLFSAGLGVNLFID